MSMGDDIFNTGAAMSPVYNGIIKTCAVAIAPPSIVFGLSVQMLAVKIYMNQCNPGDMFKAAGAWIRLAEKNWEASDNLSGEVDTINAENWSGDDAEAFKSSAGDVNAQLKQLAVTAFLIAAQLIALGIALSVYWIYLTTCTGIMVYFLGAYLAACWTGVGDIAVRASALTTAGTLLATAETFEAAMKPIMLACTALTSTLTVFTWGFQAGAGNRASPGDIVGASVMNMVEGFGTYWLRKVTMPAGMYSTGMAAENAIQAVSPFAPIYQGGNPFDGDNWSEGGYNDGGGAGLGLVDGLSNLVESADVDLISNPDDIAWK